MSLRTAALGFWRSSNLTFSQKVAMPPSHVVANRRLCTSAVKQSPLRQEDTYKAGIQPKNGFPLSGKHPPRNDMLMAATKRSGG
jgi:hypothetical protein